MTITKTITIIFLCLSCIFVKAQTTPQDSIIKAYNFALSSIVLLKNNDQIIPVRDLATTRVAFVNFGLVENDTFPTTLQKYTQFPHLYAPLDNTPAEVNKWMIRYGEEYDLFILGLNNYEALNGEALYKKASGLLQALIEQKTTIAVVFEHPKAMELSPILKQADALMLVPPIDYASSLAAQVIFGAVGIEKVMTSQAIGRLGYAPPEVENMDRQILNDSIQSVIEEGIREGAFPGGQVLVAKKGKVVYHKAFGYHTYDSLHPVQTTDIYDFASVTKVSSALAAVMKLHGEGRFDLEAPLEQYFPEYKGSNKGHLTFRSMLAHNARLRPWIPYWQGTLKKNAKYPWDDNWNTSITNDYNFRWSTFKRDSSRRFPIRVTDDLWLHRKFKEKKIYKAIKKSPLNDEPGYVYSGLLFYLLPDIVERLTNEDYETYLKKNFYHPLGAWTLTYNPLRFYRQSRIVPTERDTFFRMSLLHGRVHDEGAAMMAGVSANAGLFGSANDLAKLFQMYMNYGTYGNETYIAEETLREFTSCQYCESDNRRGLGFDKPLIEYDPERSSVAEAASPASFGHSGYTGTFVWADPKEELIYIFFSNRVYPTRNNSKIYRLNIRPRIHTAIYEAIERGR